MSEECFSRFSLFYADMVMQIKWYTIFDAGLFVLKGTLSCALSKSLRLRAFLGVGIHKRYRIKR